MSKYKDVYIKYEEHRRSPSHNILFNRTHHCFCENSIVISDFMSPHFTGFPGWNIIKEIRHFHTSLHTDSPTDLVERRIWWQRWFTKSSKKSTLYHYCIWYAYICTVYDNNNVLYEMYKYIIYIYRLLVWIGNPSQCIYFLLERAAWVGSAILCGFSSIEWTWSCNRIFGATCEAKLAQNTPRVEWYFSGKELCCSQ